MSDAEISDEVSSKASSPSDATNAAESLLCLQNAALPKIYSLMKKLKSTISADDLKGTKIEELEMFFWSNSGSTVIKVSLTHDCAHMSMPMSYLKH